MKNQELQQLATTVRAWILTITTSAGSGHPTSSLSAADLMTVLFFGGFFRYDIKRPNYHNNDRIIFSKGHASPLLYALFAVAGAITKRDLRRYRHFGSMLEGHPSIRFPHTLLPTGSLGQGLSAGVGCALAARMDRLPYKTFVLLGDSEMAEGQVWEAMQFAAYHKLDNLIAIIDVNRLGQTGETMFGHNLRAYEARLRAFGWNTVCINGHAADDIARAYAKALSSKGRPFAIIAKTLKGKGVSFLENRQGWHGKVLNKNELRKALRELGKISWDARSVIAKPRPHTLHLRKRKNPHTIFYSSDALVSTRRAYGNALVRLFPKYPQAVVVDAEVANSTFAELFEKKFPKNFFEMFIAEQNMASVAAGLAKCGKMPMVSSFSAFLSRAYDQFRMIQYANIHMLICGSHAGVSIGQDGPSQMGLQDIAMFRTLENTTVVYPSDAIAAEKLVEQAIRAPGIVYIRTTRSETPLLYKPTESFPIGKSKTLRSSKKDVATVIAAGITVHEALAAYEELQKEKICIRVIDCYSIKPIDVESIRKAARETKALIVVEDHVPEGGIVDAVRSAFIKHSTPIISLSVGKTPRSGTPQELLEYEGISRKTIRLTVKRVIR